MNLKVLTPMFQVVSRFADFAGLLCQYRRQPPLEASIDICDNHGFAIYKLFPTGDGRWHLWQRVGSPDQWRHTKMDAARTQHAMRRCLSGFPLRSGDGSYNHEEWLYGDAGKFF